MVPLKKFCTCGEDSFH